ncbi:MAG TPA: PAS domain S-box protein, partial [Actinobacteria bacterium]|nr:PAS domain S-box protein [Actinomycetota bacterium]
VHDHLCLIYETEAEQFSTLIPFIKFGLQKGEKCLYVADYDISKSVLKAIGNTKIDNEEMLNKGALEIMPERETFLQKGTFDPDAMISFLKESITRARFEGFTALRFIEDMSWALEEEPGSERLIEYESRLNYFIKQHDCLALCQYNRRAFPPSLLLEVLRVQPLVIFRNMVLENYLRVPPDELIKGPAAELNRQLENIALLNNSWERGPTAANKFRRSVDNLLDNFGIFSAIRDKTSKIVDFRVDYANKTAYKTSRITFDEHVEKKLYDLLPARAETGLLDAFANVVETGQPFSQEGATFEDIHEGQAQKRFLNIGASKLDDSVVATWRDVTEEKQVADLASLFFQTIEEAPDGFQIADLTGKLFYCNRKTQALFGYSAQEMTGMPVDNLCVDPKLIGNVVMPAVMKAGRWDGEVQVKSKDGSLFLIWLAMSMAKNKDGNPMAMVGEIRDITETKKTEATLRKSELWSRNIIDTAQEGIWILDSEANTSFVNPQMTKFLGYSKEEMIGQPQYYFMDEEAGVEAREYFKQREKGIAEKYDFRFKHKNGAAVWAIVATTPMSTETGEFSGALAMITDITNRKSAEDSLYASERRYKLLFERSPVSIWEEDWAEVKNYLDNLLAQGITDLRTHFAQHPKDVMRCVKNIRVTDVNQTSLDLYGATTKDELVKNFRNLFPPESLKPLMESFFGAIEGQFVHESENITKLFSGDTLNISERIFIPEEYEKTWERVIVNIIDLTALKRATMEIRQLNKSLKQRIKEQTNELEAANQELESLSYSVSHNLQEPLRAIDGFSQILWDDYSKSLDDEGKRLLDIVNTETVRMKQLIDDLLAFSRSGRVKINPDQVDMTELANEVSYQLTQLEPERNIKLKIKTLSSTHGDMILLKQVFANLISNAIKFTATRERAIIEIGGWTEDDENIYFIEDNGLGFDMRFVDKLFGMFERLGAGDDFAGTGVGLAIVKRIIERHGGRVWAEGQPNKGSTFYFSLPKAGAASQPAAA